MLDGVDNRRHAQEVNLLLLVGCDVGAPWNLCWPQTVRISSFRRLSCKNIYHAFGICRAFFSLISLTLLILEGANGRGRAQQPPLRRQTFEERQEVIT